jgi:site-specific DNA recombinase
VRRIFEDYAGGKSPKAIAHALNREKIPGPSGKGWGQSTINGNWRRGTGIPNNELYIGRLAWNRLSYIKNPDAGNRVSRLNDRAAWIIKDVPELRIIDQELWDRVKARQGQLRKQPAFHQRQRPAQAALLSAGLRIMRRRLQQGFAIAPDGPGAAGRVLLSTPVQS